MADAPPCTSEWDSDRNLCRLMRLTCRPSGDRIFWVRSPARGLPSWVGDETNVRPNSTIATWLNLKDRLMPNGRFMVNCGGIHEKSDTIGGIIHPKLVDGTWVENSTIKALFEAFPGQVSWKRMPETQGANFLALTGPFPDLTFWSSKVPDPLSETVRQWRPYDSIP
ncbi:hypothetical protein GH714_031486 [Hevea brasiliensis]|uniref:Uncharacterized protein n=1 Tax=Hevea brasiliensis TaxID=3981 RepID=A0A6A6KH25_HEVBR|nr:hypothetical protein GH714_031486 [Hevea brasiliensis]